MLARAERMHRQFFQPVRSVSRLPAWEPPADVLESAEDVLVVVALPGVKPEAVEVAIEVGATCSSPAPAPCRRSCARPSFIGWSCRRGASSAA